MSFLFISRNNVHARYYRKLIPQLGLTAHLHVMGKPKLSAWRFLKMAWRSDLAELIATQARRKQAKQQLIWQLPLVLFLYRALLFGFEYLRLAKYLALLTELQPAKVVLWNGKKLPNQTVVLAAEQLAIAVCFFENGLLPNTTSLDPRGVNEAASLVKNPAFYLRQTKLTEPLFKAPVIEQRKADIRRKAELEQTLPKRYIFVPFQVPHDTQVVCYSPWISDMEALFDAVMKAVKSLNQPDLMVIFKEHPSWHKHYSHLYHKDPQACFANANLTQELILGAQAVITINSTVGLEGLLLNKKVITLGQACFNLDGLVLHCGNQHQLEIALQRLPNWQPNQLLRNAYFNYLQQVYCIAGRWFECSNEHVQAVKARLLATDAFSKGEYLSLVSNADAAA